MHISSFVPQGTTVCQWMWVNISQISLGIAVMIMPNTGNYRHSKCLLEWGNEWRVGSLVPETFSWQIKERYHGVRREERKEGREEGRKEGKKERKEGRKKGKKIPYTSEFHSPLSLFLCLQVGERLRDGLECSFQRGKEGTKKKEHHVRGIESQRFKTREDGRVHLA